MKRGDILWLAVLAAISSMFLIPAGHVLFVGATKAHPLWMAFVKFAVLATMGELLAIRIVSGAWKSPPGVATRAFVWGLFGIVIALMFEIFSSGVTTAAAKGLLFTGDVAMKEFFIAFWISSIMNLTFAPTFMTVHRITDTYIDLSCAAEIPLYKVSFGDVLSRIDWQGIASFVVLRTIPFFWIPAHTATFLLPPEYRILVAAYLSIALGAILAYAKRRKLSV